MIDCKGAVSRLGMVGFCMLVGRRVENPPQVENLPHNGWWLGAEGLADYVGDAGAEAVHLGGIDAFHHHAG